MAVTKLKTRAPYISAEALSVGAAAETIATAGGTIHSNAGNIWFYVLGADTVYWHPSGTPTTSWGHFVGAKQWGMLTHAQQGAKIKSGDGSDADLIIVYERGSGPQVITDTSQVTAPY